MKILEISAESQLVGPFALIFNDEDTDFSIVTLATFLGRAVP
jgi:hypothetical protein